MIVDFHSHILPQLDDGSSSVEESLQMLRMEAEQGINYVIATPHFYVQEDSPKQFLEKRSLSERKLREAIRGIKGLPKVIIGAEVYYFPGISESNILSKMVIQNTKAILIEMPPAPWTDRMYGELEEIYNKGYIPVVAHVDRYIQPFRTYDIPKRLEKLPVLVQTNAEFFLQKSTRKMALRMLMKDRIHLLGSDCHNTKNRIPNISEAVDVIKQFQGENALNQIHLYEKCVLHSIKY